MDDDEFWFNDTYQDRSSALAQAKYRYRAIRFNEDFDAGKYSIPKKSKPSGPSSSKGNKISENYEVKSEDSEFAVNSDGNIIDPNGSFSYQCVSVGVEDDLLDSSSKRRRRSESGRFQNRRKVQEIRMKKLRKLLTAIDELSASDAGILDLTSEVEEAYFELTRDTSSSVKLMYQAVKNVLHDEEKKKVRSRGGRPKQHDVNEALKCYIWHCKANNIAIATSRNDNFTSKTIKEALVFMNEVAPDEPFTEDSIRNRLRELTGEKLSNF